MYLSDDILKAITKSKGNSNLLARLVLQKGDDFAKAIINTQLLDDFCDLARMYGDDVADIIAHYGDDVIGIIDKFGNTANDDFMSVIKNGTDFDKALETYELVTSSPT